MAYTKTQALGLLNAAEMELFEASRAESVKTLSEARLRGKAKRSRALREKYRDLLQRQKLATRQRSGSKMGVSGAANQRTEHKAALFAEVLERFEKRQAQLAAAQSRADARTAASAARLALMQQRADARHAALDGDSAPTRSTKARARAPVAQSDGLGAPAEGARAVRALRQRQQSGAQRIQGHVGTQVRRAQARRDSRGA